MKTGLVVKIGSLFEIIHSIWGSGFSRSFKDQFLIALSIGKAKYSAFNLGLLGSSIKLDW